ncbi:MAG: metal-dependent transcriptional regulator [Oscillospiraceae bacterium]|nr:metal-dependent transcriptional regulator [Oscillospiraceae bacterium]
MKDRILESKENYLETILILQNRLGNVRSVDIAAEMEFTKPSVSVAMKNLRNEGCIEVDKNGYIMLTKQGLEIAESVYERHLLFTKWLTSLGIPKETAEEDACRMEHCLSAESFSAIKAYIEKNGIK